MEPKGTKLPAEAAAFVAAFDDIFGGATGPRPISRILGVAHTSVIRWRDGQRCPEPDIVTTIAGHAADPEQRQAFLDAVDAFRAGPRVPSKRPEKPVALVGIAATRQRLVAAIDQGLGAPAVMVSTVRFPGFTKEEVQERMLTALAHAPYAFGRMSSGAWESAWNEPRGGPKTRVDVQVISVDADGIDVQVEPARVVSVPHDVIQHMWMAGERLCIVLAGGLEVVVPDAGDEAPRVDVAPQV